MKHTLFTLVLILLPCLVVTAQSDPPYHLGVLDQAVDTMDLERVQTVPLGDGYLIFDNLPATGFLFYFDGSSTTQIGKGYQQEYHDVGPVAGGRIIGIHPLVSDSTELFFISEVDRSIMPLGTTIGNYVEAFTVDGRLVLYFHISTPERQLLAIGSTPEEVTFLPIDALLGGVLNIPFRYFDGKLLLAATNKLIITDGTVMGTEVLADAKALLYQRTVIYNDQLFFTDGGNIFVSDGTRATTRLLTDENFPEDLRPSAMGGMIVTDQGVLYTARTEQHGAELFLTDGTANGTTLLTELTPGPADGLYLQPFENIAESAEGLMLFLVSQDQFRTEVWQSDGTEVGTKRLNTYEEGISASATILNVGKTANEDAYWWVRLGRDEGAYLYGAALSEDQPIAEELLTVRNTSIIGGVGGKFTTYNDWFFFLEGVDNHAFFQFDSLRLTLEGHSLSDLPSNTLATSDAFYIYGRDNDIGWEPRIFSPGDTSIHLLKDIQPGENSSQGHFFGIDEGVYYLGRNNALGYGIYQTDGTPEGTTLVTDLHQRGSSTEASLITTSGPYLISENLSRRVGWVDFSREEVVRFRFGGLPTGPAVGKYFVSEYEGNPLIIGDDYFWPFVNDAAVSPNFSGTSARWQDKFVFSGSGALLASSNSWQAILMDPETRELEILVEISDVPFDNQEIPSQVLSNGEVVFFTLSHPDSPSVLYRYDGTLNENDVYIFPQNDLPTKGVDGLNGEVGMFQVDSDEGQELLLLQYDRFNPQTFQLIGADEKVCAVAQLEDYTLVMTDRQLSHTVSIEDLSEDETDILADEHTGDHRLAALTKVGANRFCFLRQAGSVGEIWTTDGTTAGTRLLSAYSGKAINPEHMPLPRINGWLALTVERPDENRYLLLFDYRNEELHELAEVEEDGGWPSVAQSFDDRFYFLLTTDIFGREIHYLDFGTPNSGAGFVFSDLNGNGIKDVEESGVPGQQVRVRDEDDYNFALFSEDQGAYRHKFLPGKTYTYSSEPVSCWEPVPGFENIMATADESYTSPDIPLRPIIVTEKLRAYLTSGPTRCNSEVPYWLYAFSGCSPLENATVSLLLPDALTFESAVEMPDRITDNLLEWNNLQLSQQDMWSAALTLGLPDESRAGEDLPFRMIVRGLSSTGDFIADTTYYSPTLRCAIDPNDKLVTPARPEESNSNYTQIDETLTYTIRFQNTGNDTALNVRLEDQLAAELDLNTFKPIAASHNYRVELVETGRLKVYFDDIFLPDSNVNETASHGFFAFDISLKEEGLNTSVENTAGIFFDFNAPVITNTVTNSIVEFLDEDQDNFFFWDECDDTNPDINPGVIDIGGNGIDEDCDGQDWTTSVRDHLPGTLRVFPNPTPGAITIQYSLPVRLFVTVFDGRGRRMQTTELRSSGQVDLSNLPAAAYYLQVMEVATGRFNTQRVVRW